MPSVDVHSSVVKTYVVKERKAGRIIGPLSIPNIHVNRINVILKDHTLGRWRLITDLSHACDRSINNGIDLALCSLSYVTVDTVVRVVQALGTGTLMAKVDIDSAYRLIPVHPDDPSLLGSDGTVMRSAM